MAYKHETRAKGDPIRSDEWNRMGRALEAVTERLDGVQAQTELREALLSGLEDKIRGLESRLGDVAAQVLAAPREVPAARERVPPPAASRPPAEEAPSPPVTETPKPTSKPTPKPASKPARKPAKRDAKGAGQTPPRKRPSST